MPNETHRASARYKNSPFFSSLLGNNYWTMNGPRNGLCRRTAEGVSCVPARTRDLCRDGDLGARCLAATTCKDWASFPGGQEQRNFGPIGPQYGSIIRAMASLCGIASKNLEMYRTFAL